MRGFQHHGIHSAPGAAGAPSEALPLPHPHQRLGDGVVLRQPIESLDLAHVVGVQEGHDGVHTPPLRHSKGGAEVRWGAEDQGLAQLANTLRSMLKNAMRVHAYGACLVMQAGEGWGNACMCSGAPPPQPQRRPHLAALAPARAAAADAAPLGRL